MAASDLPLIDVEHLRIGMYVVLDVGWKNHPFLRSRFTIRSDEQLAQLRAMGVAQVRWSPQRSEVQAPITATEPEVAVTAPLPAAATSGPDPQPAAGQRMQPVSLDEWESLSQHWMQSEYADVAGRHAALLKALRQDPTAARESAEQLADMVSTAVSECDRPAVRLLTEKAGQEQAGHEVAVVALSLLLGRDAGLDEEALRQLALAALLHDIGKIRLPASAQEDSGELAGNDLKLFRSHVAHGLELGRQMGLEPAVLRSIAEHHEHADGSGFPEGLRAEQMSDAGKVLAITNRYVNLVCPQRSDQGLTPHQALQQMYGRERARFDATLLSRFVRLLGVYPPGSLVELSDGRIALVVASRPGASLTPRVRIIVSPDAEELSPALDIDGDSPFKISRSLPPEKLDPAWAKRSRELARAAFFFEPAPSPEWRSWGDEERESEASF
jgi:putative nucleotidyltransferase with HDIG domain